MSYDPIGPENDHLIRPSHHVASCFVVAIALLLIGMVAFYANMIQESKDALVCGIVTTVFAAILFVIAVSICLMMGCRACCHDFNHVYVSTANENS